MKVIDVQQGSPEWIEHRAKTRNASDAPVMMGVSKKATRNDLIRVLATGVQLERSEWVETVLFARGHEVEAAARAIAEEVVGDDLFPVVAIDQAGYLGASFDGLTMDGRIGWECKQWNEAKAAEVRAGKVPEEDRWQVIQQLVISDAERWLYVVTDGTREKTAWCWVEPPSHRDVAKLMAGWKQLDEDVANYLPTESVIEAPKAPVESLPSVAVRVDGQIAIVDNLSVFGSALKGFIERINLKPDTDEDFAAAESAIKTLEKAQDALDAAKSNGLAQVASVDQMVRTVDGLAQLARTTRLNVEKLVKQRKDQIRLDAVTGGKTRLGEHIVAINKRIAPVVLSAIEADFAGVIKGKKTVASLRNAIDTELARAKIAANETADRIDTNLRLLNEHQDHRFLFNDLQQIALKEPDDFASLVKVRIADHQAAEEKRLEEQRERIRQEEAARAQRESDAKVEAARVEIRAEEQTKAREVAAMETPVPVLPERASEKTSPGHSSPHLPAALFKAPLAAREPVTIEQTTERFAPANFVPTAHQMVALIADHFEVDRMTARAWLISADFAKVLS